MSGPLVFLASNSHLATRNSKFRAEVELECSKDLFFWSASEFGGKLWNKIELLCLTKLCKNILPSRNLLNQQKSTPMSVMYNCDMQYDCQYDSNN